MIDLDTWPCNYSDLGSLASPGIWHARLRIKHVDVNLVRISIVATVTLGDVSCSAFWSVNSDDNNNNNDDDGKTPTRLYLFFLVSGDQLIKNHLGRDNYSCAASSLLSNNGTNMVFSYMVQWRRLGSSAAAAHWISWGVAGRWPWPGKLGVTCNRNKVKCGNA